MKKNILLPLFVAAFGLFSCQPEQPKEKKFLYESNVVAGNYGWCCDKPGTNCVGPDRGILVFTTLKTYIEQDNLAGYFLNENWQNEFPLLVNEPEIVDYVLNSNPRGLLIGEDLFLILKDKAKGKEAENVYAAVMLKADVSCKEYLSL